MGEQEFQNLLQAVPVAVYTCDLFGRITYYNKRAAELWGREPAFNDLERFCGAFQLYQLDGTPLPHDQSPMSVAVRTGHVPQPNQELMIERPDGSRIIVMVNIAVMKNSEGERIGAVNCIQDITDGKAAEEALQRSERLLGLVVDTLPVGVAVVDLCGDIILTNPALKRIWGRSIAVGRDRYTESRGWWHASGKRIRPEEWASKRAILNGETSINEVIDIEAFDGARKIIQNSAAPIQDSRGHSTGAVIVNEDISARKEMESELNDSYNQLRTLTARLMSAQDDERRRVARLLHETAAQDLIALKMNLAKMAGSNDIARGNLGPALAESIELTDACLQEVRTLSHLLHPPLLEEAGLLPALRWYVSGFGERSGIAVMLDVPDELDRLPQEIEIAIFRVVQEALANIHRHSGSHSAKVQLVHKTSSICLQVKDEGKGMQTPDIGQSVGVGIQAMRERIQHLGGTFALCSNTSGTLLKVVLPIGEGVPC